MKPLSLALIAVGILLLGYSMYAISPSKSEVEAAVAELTPEEERQAINTNILEHEAIKKVEAYKVFGERPVTIDPNSLHRSNPFEGI